MIKIKLKGMAKKEKRTRKGSSPKRSTDRSAVIAELFRSFPGKKYTIKNLASASGGNDKEGRYRTREIVEAMKKEGLVVEPEPGKYKLSTSQMPTYEGVVDLAPSGAAYVKVEGFDKDVFVDARNANHALQDDVVRLVIIRRKRSGDPEGEITEIIRRADKQYVGRVELTRNHAFVRIDSRKMPYDIFVQTKGLELHDNDKVVVKIKEWPADTKSPVGEIIDVLGPAGDNDTEMHAILAEFNLPYKYPEDVEKAADEIPSEIPADEIARRRDFRDVTTFTIDPADAKDFDDALSIRSIGEGKWEVGVHIADVTYYVKEDSIIEAEGRERATSVYLVDRTIPMLPEKLSNFLCSLRPDEEKLCFSAVFEMDEELNITKEWLGRTIIKSNRRFTYEEAQQIIETGEGDFKEEVLTLNRLAQKMRAERFRNGAITFGREEAKFTLDEKGKPTGVYFKVQKEANQLIEEFMLLANRKVAEFVGRKRGEGANAERTFVYRVHDKPDPDKLEKFSSFILKFGYYFKPDAKGKEISQELNRLLKEIKGKSEENVISTLAIRSMAKAYYSTDNIGHYGLAFRYYTHFTSPIRRYPDMMVHRLLARYLAGGKSADIVFYKEQCEHSSDMEVVAAEAERASVKYKMVEFMEDKIGQEFDGVISGVTERGIYVELNDTHIEGMVAIRDMADDIYVFDENEYALRGHRSGRKLMLGDNVRIRVKSADLAHKQLDFELAGTIDFGTGVFHPIEAPRIQPEEPKRGKHRKHHK